MHRSFKTRLPAASDAEGTEMLSSSACITMAMFPSATCCVCLPHCQKLYAGHTESQRQTLAGWRLLLGSKTHLVVNSRQSRVTERQTDQCAGFNLSHYVKSFLKGDLQDGMCLQKHDSHSEYM